MKLKNLFIFFLLLFSVLSHAEEIELLKDVKFKNGVNLLAPNLSKKVVIAKLQKQNCNQKPGWFLAQWHSKHSLSNALRINLPDGETKFSNKTKTIIFGNENGKNADIVLGVDSRNEFGKKVRKKGESWPHLLLNREDIEIIPFKNIDKVQMHLEANFKKALKVARERGFLKNSINDDDFAISSFILGWEVPGLNNVMMQVRNLNLKVITKAKK